MLALTWAERVELIFSTEEQIPAEFPGVDFLGGGRGRTQREATAEKGFFLHGLGAGRLLEGRKR